jgi:hypothetical protein
MNKVQGIGGSRADSGSRSGPKLKQAEMQIKFSACRLDGLMIASDLFVLIDYEFW